MSTLFWFLSANVLYAQDPCVGVPGGCTSGGNVLLNLLPAVGQLLVGLCGGAAVLFVVWGGVQMMLNFGDDSKISSGKSSITYALAGFALALASQTLVAFVYGWALPIGVSSQPLVTALSQTVAAILSLMNIGFVLLCMIAGFRMVIGKGSSDEFNKAKTMIIWVAIGALVVNVAHALVRAILLAGF